MPEELAIRMTAGTSPKRRRGRFRDTMRFNTGRLCLNGMSGVFTDAPAKCLGYSAGCGRCSCSR